MPPAARGALDAPHPSMKPANGLPPPRARHVR